jgi:hypothetical protein
MSLKELVRRWLSRRLEKVLRVQVRTWARYAMEREWSRERVVERLKGAQWVSSEVEPLASRIIAEEYRKVGRP